MAPIRIVHVSDLHLSEHILRGSDDRFHLPHRYGHDVKVFFALDSFLKSTEWDFLVITGDISRVGNQDSFEWARNWLESDMTFGDRTIGLNLKRIEGRSYVIVPGNHDRFNGKLKQSSLDQYYQEFPLIRIGTVQTFQIRSQIVNFHLFDSTKDGSFAYGKIEEKYMVSKNLSPHEINIALLHHHFVQPPKHRRETAAELVNSADVAAYMLTTPFDCVMFGHTHQSYIGRPSVLKLTDILNDRRVKPRWLKRLCPKCILRRIEKDGLVSYRRKAARNGQLPTLESYFDYLYLSLKDINVRGPESFSTIREFYTHINTIQAEQRISKELEDVRSRHVLISLAPSACQTEAKWKGFHVMHFSKSKNGSFSATWERYQFNGAQFIKKEQHEHVS